MKKHLLPAIIATLLLANVTAAVAIAQESKLGWFESRIATLSDEFMRRSPALAATFEAFKVCLKTPGCNSVTIIEERDSVISQEWPGIFDRLEVRSDWGRLRVSASERDRFFETLTAFGRDKLRNHCVPRFEYRERVLGRNRVPTYNFEAFVCTSNPSRPPT